MSPPVGTVDPAVANDTATDTDVVLTTGACGALEDRALSQQTINTTELFEACNSISAGSSFTIDAPGDVTFRAGTEIVLRNGFSVTGGQFQVLIEIPTP